MSDLAVHRLSDVAELYSVCTFSLKDGKFVDSLCSHAQAKFRAASVIKIGIMSALLNDVMSGRCRLEDKVRIEESNMVGGAGVLFELASGHEFRLDELCRLMMVVSDNTASNACLRAVGMERLNAFFEARAYVARVERYFMSPVVDGRDNSMTAESAALMLRDIYEGRELNDELREFAMGCLRRQQYREKIPLMIPEQVAVAHKTGELDGVRHDAAIVECAEPYILCLFTERGREPWVVDRAMAECSRSVFDEMAGLKR